MKFINTAVIGCGYWGPNLIRNLAEQKEARIVSLCDLDEEKLKKQKQKYLWVKTTTQTGSILRKNNSIDAVVIATPPRTHFGLAKTALSSGKHVLVEKPLALSVKEAQELVNLARKNKKILMVGHTFLYNLAIRKLKEYIDKGILGRIFYIYTQRLNLGIIRSDVNALWNFGPHDIAILLYLLGKEPTAVSCWGLDFLQKGIEDVVFLRLEFPGKIGAHLQISWLDPQKVRKVVVVGSRKMVVFDDTNPEVRIQLFDSGIQKIPRVYPHLQFETFAEFQLLTRVGDLTIPKIEFKEPLLLECQDFIESIRTGKKPLADGEHGLAVVKILEAAQRSLEENNQLIRI